MKTNGQNKGRRLWFAAKRSLQQKQVKPKSIDVDIHIQEGPRRMSNNNALPSNKHSVAAKPCWRRHGNTVFCFPDQLPPEDDTMQYLVMEDAYTTVVREFYYTVKEIKQGEFIILRQNCCLDCRQPMPKSPFMNHDEVYL